MKKRLLLVALILLVILSPRIYWSLKQEKTLDIAVVDKSVPQKDYREHNGFFQVLHSEKIVRPDGELYDVGRDYYGFDPYDQVATELFRSRPLDMIYVADTYGVYSDDVERKPDGDRSELIYGGMDLLEWNELMASKGEQTTLIAEFNSFASPTSEEVGEIMQRNLGIAWGGWIGRYFQDLSNDEIPQWLIDSYENQEKEEWLFDGSGMAYVHTSGQVVVLDRDDIKRPVQFELTEQGRRKFPSVRSSAYLYWFDIVEPVGETDVLATYDVGLSDSGHRKLQSAGLPDRFPAVLSWETERTFYFAGDYADFDKRPIVTWQGIHHLYKYFAKDVSAFYWLTYFPMMETILDELDARKSGGQVGD